MPLPARSFVVAALLLGACGGPVPSVSPVSPTTPSAIQSPTDPPTSLPIQTPGYVPPSVAISLEIDGLAQVEVRRLRQVVDPDNPNANPRQNRALRDLMNGDVVLLMDGPRSVGGRDYWQVYDDTSPMPFDDRDDALGWVAAQREDIATLTPFLPDCPAVLPTTARDLPQPRRMGDFTGFACFGSREIVLTGHVRCYRITSDGVLAAPFFDSNRACEIDGVNVDGEPIFALLPTEGPARVIEGRYQVRGQFNHPDSQRCTWIPFGTDRGGPSGVPDPGAVSSCRRVFVVTAVEVL